MLSINRTYCRSTMHQAYFLKSITQTVLLEKQAASLSPSLFQQTSKMPPPPLYVLKTFPSLTDHIWRHWSRDPLARYSPLGLKATEYTGCLQLNNELMTDTDKRSSDNVYGNWYSKLCILLVASQTMEKAPLIYVPQLNGRIKGSTEKKLCNTQSLAKKRGKVGKGY